MILSMNALAGFSLQQSKKQNIGFREKANNQPKTRETVCKKRSFAEFDQVEKNRTFMLPTGKHPVLKVAEDQITRLTSNLKKVEEQSTFWRQKTLDLQSKLLSSENNATRFGEQVEKLEKEQVVLQNKVAAAEEQSSTISGAMRSLIAENNELNETITLMDEELNAMMKCGADDAKSGIQVMEDVKVCIALEKALEDTMADLTEHLAEIEDLKKLLVKVTIEKNLLEKEVTKKQIIAEIVDINPTEIEGNIVNGKIAKLEEAVEKCMFRIAVLTQKNEELRKLHGDFSFSSDQDVSMIEVLEDNERLSVLESVCMQRYRKLLKETAEELVSEETMNDLL